MSWCHHELEEGDLFPKEGTGGGSGAIYLAYQLEGAYKHTRFETRTATGGEHFACKGHIISQIFILLISNGEKIFSNVNVVV